MGIPSRFPSDGQDELHGHGGHDFLRAGGGDDSIFGDDLRTELGNDTLDGGTGADALYGGKGHDVHIVDNLGDQVYEVVGGTAGGIDRVQSATIDVDLNHYEIGFGLENAMLLGTKALNATGTSVRNVLTANLLEGMAGNDTVLGDGGNDTLLGEPGGDTLVGGAGSDVFSFGKLIGSVPGAMDEIFGEGVSRRSRGPARPPVTGSTCRISTRTPPLQASRASSSVAPARATSRSSIQGWTPSSGPTWTMMRPSSSS